MTGNEYQQLASRTINQALTTYGKRQHALFGMAAEVGELLGLYQKSYQGHELIEEHEQKEVSDILWFIAEYCTVQGWEFDDIMQMNIDKLKARFPDGFDPEKSLHRKEGDV